MIKSRTQSERSVVVVDVVLVVVVAVEGASAASGGGGGRAGPEAPEGRADGEHSGHGHDNGHVYDNDPLRLSRDYGSGYFGPAPLSMEACKPVVASAV
jgi:hypothetical protein